ncbi:MAG TPA: MFS transporter [Acidimicrobiales bacterium]|jgi:EmrB/QacA subfamily drug resistance transporter
MTSTLIERARPHFSRPVRSVRSTGGGAAQAKFVLPIILATYLMIILDATIVITALPRIHRALGFSSTGLSWVQNAYTLTFGGLLLLGARAGDILGRRRVFVAGIALFTVASLAGGLARSAAWLLAARAVQGIGAAIAAPSTLALLQISFPEGPQRARAIGAYSAVAGAGGSVGLVLGGMLTSWVSWRWGLFINVPLGAALVFLAPRYLPESERRHGRFDLAGAATSTLGMSSLVYGFVRAASAGWGNRGTVAAFVAGAALLGAFALTEMRAEQPITPLHLFASRQRTGAYAARVLVVSGMFAMFFFLTQYLQGVRGYSALGAGLAFLPVTAVMFGAARMAPRLAPRVGNSRLLIGGVFTALVGMTLLSRIGAATPYFPGIAVPMLLLGLGIGSALTPLTTAGVAGVDPHDAGAASGVVNVAQQLGGSLGLGILVTVFAAADRAAQHIPAASARLQTQHALAHAVATSLRGSALFLALGLAVVVLVMRRPAVRVAEPVAEPETRPADGAAHAPPVFPPVRAWVHGPEYGRGPGRAFDLAARDEAAVDERKCS